MLRPTLSSSLSFPRTYPIVLLLILLCSVIEAILLLGDLGVFGGTRLRAIAYEYGAFWPGLLHNWHANYPSQPWLMFATYSFLHGGVVHLVFNMITLASLGMTVQDRAGPTGFFAIYALSVVLGGAFYAALGDASTPMVGASGGLFGLAGAIVAWIWLSRPNTRSSIRATRRILIVLILMNVILFIAFAGRVAWETHLGGFAAGWLTAVIQKRTSRIR
ncbi:rhomboid family intramembrane serine protease [Aliiruegeria haliotis]|nr:rhomboid family intramembrane serine protease [Aliiruegeria haliotis]